MKVTGRIAVGVAVLALMQGCTTPKPQGRTQTVVVEGKRFVIPQGAIAADHLATAREADFFVRSGVAQCRKGDLTWEMPQAQQRVGKAIAQGDAKTHQALAKEGLIGCVSAS